LSRSPGHKGVYGIAGEDAHPAGREMTIDVPAISAAAAFMGD
jgi:hypothetical protein